MNKDFQVEGVYSLCQILLTSKVWWGIQLISALAKMEVIGDFTGVGFTGKKNGEKVRLTEYDRKKIYRKWGMANFEEFW